MTNWEFINEGEEIICDGKKGILLTKPKYQSGRSWGCHVADIKWEGGEVTREMKLWRMGLQTLKEFNEWYATKHTSIEVSTITGDHWVLFGEDLQDYKDGKLKVKYGMEFKDKKSHYYDSSD